MLYEHFTNTPTILFTSKSYKVMVINVFSSMYFHHMLILISDKTILKLFNFVESSKHNSYYKSTTAKELYTLL